MEILFYIFIFISLFLLEITYFYIAKKGQIVDKPNHRSSHSQTTIRGGGIIFYFASLLYFFVSGFEYLWFITGLSLISLISFWDDIKSLDSLPRLLCQVISILCLFYQWEIFYLSWWWIIVLMVFSVGVINAYNFMDGINGMTGGYSLIVIGSLAYVNHKLYPFVDPALINFILISLIIFNFYNFRKRAICFAGDIGSVSIGFIILFLLGKLIIFTQDISWIILLVVYGVDTTFTIIHRILLHESISQPHRKHAYQLMANELNIKHIIVSLIYMLTQLFILVFFIAFPGLHWIILLSGLLYLSVSYILFIRRYYHLHVNSSPIK